MFKLHRDPVVLGLTGGPAAGKDTVAGLLVRNHGFTHVGFSDALRDFMYATDDAFRMAVDLYGYTGAKAEVSGLRDRMIEVGTAARDWINPYIWLDAVELKVNEAIAEERSIVVTGVRYANESWMIRGNGGLVIGIDRPGVEFENDTYYQTFLDADDYIENHFGLDHLVAEVDELVSLTEA